MTSYLVLQPEEEILVERYNRSILTEFPVEKIAKLFKENTLEDLVQGSPLIFVT